MRINVSEKEKFVLRVAGIFMRDNSVLLHRAEHEDIWALPGGGCEFFEDTKSALIREAEEELNATIEVQSLAFTVENFFEWYGAKAHEIGFYYLAKFTGESTRFYNQNEFTGIEQKMEGFEKFRLFFRWFPIEHLQDHNIKPDFLKVRLQSISTDISHIIHRDHS